MIVDACDGVDWCHLCGVRRDGLVEITYPENAEHSNIGNKYVRMCGVCVGKIDDAFAESFKRFERGCIEVSVTKEPIGSRRAMYELGDSDG